LHRDTHSIRQKIRRIGDHGIGLPDSTHNLDRVPKIMPKRHFSKLDLIPAVHHTHLRTVRLEKDRARRKHQWRNT